LFEYDLVIAWDWEFDTEFINQFGARAKAANCGFFSINPSNLNDSLDKIRRNDLRFRVLLDRASDTSEEFDPLIDAIIFSGTKTLNEAGNAIRALDKATMHLEFLARGIDVPYSIILSAADDLSRIKYKDIHKIGCPFVIKPSRGGGGSGVVMAAETPGDIIAARQDYGDDKYLLQEKVVPRMFDSHRAYFRVFNVCGRIIPIWWDDQTHLFSVLHSEDEQKYHLERLRDITETIAEISRLDFFSTEICVTSQNRFVVVDYVNDPVDMRLCSVYKDGVPDSIIGQIIEEIMRLVRQTEWTVLTPAKKEILSRRRDFERALLRKHR